MHVERTVHIPNQKAYLLAFSSSPLIWRPRLDDLIDNITSFSSSKCHKHSADNWALILVTIACMFTFRIFITNAIFDTSWHQANFVSYRHSVPWPMRQCYNFRYPEPQRSLPGKWHQFWHLIIIVLSVSAAPRATKLEEMFSGIVTSLPNGKYKYLYVIYVSLSSSWRSRPAQIAWSLFSLEIFILFRWSFQEYTYKHTTIHHGWTSLVLHQQATDWKFWSINHKFAIRQNFPSKDVQEISMRPLIFSTQIFLDQNVPRCVSLFGHLTATLPMIFYHNKTFVTLV